MKNRWIALIALALLAALLLTACSGSQKKEEAVEYAGHYTAPDGSTLDISGSGNSTYTVEMSIVRLTQLEGTGAIGVQGLRFSATDAAGKPISATVTLSGDTATVTFTASSWEYIKNGDTFTFTR